MGVKLRLVQYPCRSGCPSGVCGKTQALLVVFAAAFLSAFAGAADLVCAETSAGTHKMAAMVMTTVKTLEETQKRLTILTSSAISTCLNSCSTGRTASFPRTPRNRNPRVGYSFPCDDKAESSLSKAG